MIPSPPIRPSHFPPHPETRVIAFAGPSNSGKTTLICRLVSWLRARGLTVAVLKHSHKLNLADIGKDTGRLRAAGAATVALAAPGVIQVTRICAGEPPLDEVLAYLTAGVNLVLVEGYKSSQLPKVAVLSPDQAQLPDYPSLIAIVSILPVSINLPQFHPDRVEDLGYFILQYLGFADVRLQP